VVVAVSPLRIPSKQGLSLHPPRRTECTQNLCRAGLLQQACQHLAETGKRFRKAFAANELKPEKNSRRNRTGRHQQQCDCGLLHGFACTKTGWALCSRRNRIFTVSVEWRPIFHATMRQSRFDGNRLNYDVQVAIQGISQCDCPIVTTGGE
jgi:hypothetical protein